MKTTSFLTGLLLYSSISFAQIDPQTPWTWIKGDNTVNQVGKYGSSCVASTINKPGARNSSATWRDATGGLWLFGGFGYAAASQGYLNDLWKYDPDSGQWTWMKGGNGVNQYGIYGSKGIPDILNKPGAAYACVSWTDNNGGLWLFGGFGFSGTTAGLLNTLWKYDPVSNQWTWMNGDNGVNTAGVYGVEGISNNTNKPGARYGSLSWTDEAGNLWLFGGNGYATNGQGILNDLWKYDPATNQWTWIKGNNTANEPAIFGTKGLANSSNKPGGRYTSACWLDDSGNTWIFGGYGYDEHVAGNLNDMWRYNPVTNQWTWMNGDKVIDKKAVFGAQGIASVNNKPGSRIVGNAWTDASGDLCMFGGFGYDEINAGYLNDIWKYNTTGNTWTWVKGDNTIDQPGVYGTLGMPAVSNKSGGRTGSVSWADGAGNLWMFGGSGYDGNVSGSLNDLWKISSLQSILPLHLLDFSGVQQQQLIHLQWQSEQETGFNYFNIERSFDGLHFISIGTMNGSLNNNRNDYTYNDPDLAGRTIEKAFYRLQLVDKDGRSTYSKVIRFDWGRSVGSLSTYPNPAVNSLTLSFDHAKNGNVRISITDMKGTIVKNISKDLQAGKISLGLDVSELSSAAYIITVNDKEAVFRQQFIKD